MNRVLVEFTDEEIGHIVKIQKKMLEAIAENTPKKFGDEKRFHISMVGIVFFFCNLILSININELKIKEFLSEIFENVINMYPEVKKNSNCYMLYENSKKIKEGKFN